jgi:FG-GAP repeat
VGGRLETVGSDLAFGAVGSGVAQLLIVGAGGGGDASTAGAVYAIDPSLQGEFAVLDLDLRLAGDARGFGGRVAPWDGGGDAQADLATTASGLGGVALFVGPWLGAGTEGDATGRWDAGQVESDSGDVLEAVGDVTGDGLADLAFAAPLWGDNPYRAGRVYVVPAAPGGPVFCPADSLEIQVRGSLENGGMGFGLAGSDIDGDGQQDLVVNEGLTSVEPGVVLVFSGPVSGSLGADDAAHRVYGVHDGDLFGRAIAPVDVDGDAQGDLAVGAELWPGGLARGAVYLIRGADLAP